MAEINFSWSNDDHQFDIAAAREKGHKFSNEILIKNIRWFIIFRWAVVAGLVLLQIFFLTASEPLAWLEVKENQTWPLAVSIILSGANFLYIYALDFCQPSRYNSPSANLWAQIIVDLICLSIVVHYVGSTVTPAPFFYILHIALACIFFSTIESLVVLIIVITMYTILLISESGMFIYGYQAVMVDGDAVPNESLTKGRVLLWMVSLNSLFLIVWYVVSRLSIVVRAHERHLKEAMEQVEQAQFNRDQYGMLVTHQLKAPLDAIRSKINLINGGYCGQVSSDIKDVLARIDKRGAGMSRLILDMLKLERLKASTHTRETMEQVSVAAMIAKCIDKLEPVTNARNIKLDHAIQDFGVTGMPDQIEIILENIISNAVTYSFDNATVEITSAVNPLDTTGIVMIADHGIGIEEKDLPNIFNEYFYSSRAVVHNKSSSGIGLSLVKIAAKNNNINIRIASAPNAGTTFTIVFHDVQPFGEKAE
ncbi:MAG: HAMP domain-containing sensor histidine kinase [Nitrosomonas sp.]|nr:HAMP domain-containing sensor histidine kinase [Nitrosomonas sp.]